MRSKWPPVIGVVGGLVSVVVFTQVFVTFEVLPVVIELDPAAVEMWKILLDFAARIAWPLVTLTTVVIFAPQIGKLIPRLIKFETPLGSGELSPDTPFEAGEIEGARKLVEETPDAVVRTEGSLEGATRIRAELDRRRDELYEPIYQDLGDLGNAILLRLQIEGDEVKSANLATAIGVTANMVNNTIRKLLHKKLAWKEGPGIVARITQLGTAYLLWLEEGRPEAYHRARSLWSGSE